MTKSLHDSNLSDAGQIRNLLVLGIKCKARTWIDEDGWGRMEFQRAVGDRTYRVDITIGTAGMWATEIKL